MTREDRIESGIRSYKALLNQRDKEIKELKEIVKKINRDTSRFSTDMQGIYL